MSKRKHHSIADFFSKRINKQDESLVSDRSQSVVGRSADTNDSHNAESQVGVGSRTNVDMADETSASTSAGEHVHTPIRTVCTHPCCDLQSPPCQPNDQQILRKADKSYQEKGHTKVRSIQPKWFETFKWLTFCQTRHKLFCHVCRQTKNLGALTFNRNVEQAFTDDGFSNWKKAINKFRDHESSLCHREAVVKSEARRQEPIVSQLSTITQQQQEKRQKALIAQLESLRFLMRQGLSIRGHTLGEGNFIELLKLRAKDVSELRILLESNSYISADIINEQICIVATQILRGIAKSIREQTWFSVIADETCDITNHEQFNVTIRWVDGNFVVHEDPVGLVWVPDTTGETLFSSLKDVLLRLQLEIHNCRGQAYDGASNMQGKARGVATRMSSVEPAAIHVHCLAHCLNLCLQEISRKSKPLRNALDLISEILRLLTWSPKRAVLFDKIKMNVSPENPRLRKLSETRWTMRTSSVDSVLKNYSIVMEVLEEVNQNGTDEYARQAGGQVALMEKFSTFYCMKLAHRFFAASEQLSLTLQNKQTSAQDAIKAASMTKLFYQRLRSDAEFDVFYQAVVNEASKIDAIEEPCLPRRRTLPRRLDEGSAGHQFNKPEDMFRKEYFEVIDLIIEEIDRRFSQPTFAFVGKLENLVLDSANGNFSSIPQDVQDMYSRDVDMDRLDLQLKMLPDLIRTQCPEVHSVTLIDTVVDALTKSDQSVMKGMMGELWKLLQIYLTIPVTSSTSERSFSALKRIKTYLRNSMTQERLNHLLVCHIYKERMNELDIKQIAIEFVERNEKRTNYFGRFK